MICTNCGFSNTPGDAFCGNCGKYLEWQPASEEGTTAGDELAPTTADEQPTTDEERPTAPLAVADPPRVSTPAPTAILCWNCARNNPVSRTFCQQCGERLDRSPVAVPSTTAGGNPGRLIAVGVGVLALLLLAGLAAFAFLGGPGASPAPTGALIAEATPTATPARPATVSPTTPPTPSPTAPPTPNPTAPPTPTASPTPWNGRTTFWASALLPGSEVAHAFDGDPETLWNSGAFPPQSIELRFDPPRDVHVLELEVAQRPTSETDHRVLVETVGAGLHEVHAFQATTQARDVLVFRPAVPLRGVMRLRIETLASQSWVAWHEIWIDGELPRP